MRNRHRAVIDVLVAAGLPEDAAKDQVERVLGAIAPALIAGKIVWLPGVGDLRPKRQRVYVPGSGDRKKREECRVSMRRGTVWKGEPYEAEPPEKSKLTYRTLGGLS